MLDIWWLITGKYNTHPEGALTYGMLHSQYGGVQFEEKPPRVRCFTATLKGPRP